jgi:dTDP-D-glucose 4,6-dehydratase
VLRCYFGKDVPLEDYAQLNFVRMGEDIRYSLDDSRLRDLGWNNAKNFDEELTRIVDYYKNKFTW